MGQEAMEGLGKEVGIGFRKKGKFLAVFGPLIDISHLNKDHLDVIFCAISPYLKEGVDMMGSNGTPIPVGTHFMTTGNYHTASILIGLGGRLQPEDHMVMIGK